MGLSKKRRTATIVFNPSSFCSAVSFPGIQIEDTLHHPENDHRYMEIFSSPWTFW